MSPRLLLSLWRERWGKASDDEPKASYQVGPDGPWGWRLAQARVWLMPGLPALATVVALAPLIFTLFVQFSLGGQILFSALLLSAALYLRRHVGSIPSLMLLGLAFLVSSRYLIWRFETTIDQGIGFALVFGLALCLSEVYLAIQLGFRLVVAFWPLERRPQALPTDREAWPTLDVVLLCNSQALSAVEASLKAARAFDWPLSKIQIYLFDHEERADLRALAQSSGAIYLSAPALDPHRFFTFQQRILNSSLGELIVVFDSEHLPQANFFRSLIGWFMRDPRLGMLHSPRHFLAPKPSARALALFNSNALDYSFVILRRSKWGEAEILRLPLPRGLTLAEKFNAIGHGSACVGPRRAAKRETSGSPVRWIRVDQTYNQRSLVARQGLAVALAALESQALIAWRMIAIVPFIYLFLGEQLIPAPPALFAAYFVPHSLHGYMVWTRTRGSRRYTVWAEIRDALMMVYLLPITAWSLIRTEILRARQRYLAHLSKTAFETGKPFLSHKLLKTQGLWLAINLIVLIHGVTQLYAQVTPNRGFAIVCLLWVIYNILLVFARFAVEQESRHIRWQTLYHLCKPVMIRLPKGRTLACSTRNFPATDLELVLPVAHPLQTGENLFISIFLEDREYRFSSEVLSQRDRVLSVRIDASARADYLAFSVLARSRGPDWPSWLPWRDADRPIPASIVNILTRFTLFIKGILPPVASLLRAIRSIQPWNKKT